MRADDAECSLLLLGYMKKEIDKYRMTLPKNYSIYKTELYNLLDAACDVDQNTLWSALRNKKVAISLNISNKIIILPVDLCKEMADKFSKVLSYVLEETINHYQERNDGSCEAF